MTTYHCFEEPGFSSLDVLVNPLLELAAGLPHIVSTTWAGQEVYYTHGGASNRFGWLPSNAIGQWDDRTCIQVLALVTAPTRSGGCNGVRDVGFCFILLFFLCIL